MPTRQFVPAPILAAAARIAQDKLDGEEFQYALPHKIDLDVVVEGRRCRGWLHVDFTWLFEVYEGAARYVETAVSEPRLSLRYAKEGEEPLADVARGVRLPCGHPVGSEDQEGTCQWCRLRVVAGAVLAACMTGDVQTTMQMMTKLQETLKDDHPGTNGNP